MAASERAAYMERSILQAARAAGLPDEELATLSRAHSLAMAPRIEHLEDDHHPAYLHPGRTVLVLLRDVGALPARPLRVAVVLESEDSELRVPDSEVRALGDEVADALGTIPSPGAEDLAERLVTLPRELALVALAERLDHLRHLHLRPELVSLWPERHEEVQRVWMPVAERTHEKLATRYAHWTRTFARRLRQG